MARADAAAEEEEEERSSIRQASIPLETLEPATGIPKRALPCLKTLHLHGHAVDTRGRRFLEPHHEEPFARGGAHTESCLTLRCRLHNDLAARDDFGDAHIRHQVQKRQQTQLALE